ncbi:hypothetical protein RclHR1_13980001 [Rhizophagus clarus]|uniref:Uncharacterized protein n=1 Tax=Rhizophagus clarus TaxID=94130 RepID=A0A2Z6QBD9_9GLOM|nr:hypothetical protein RclHR1_13980001 [Rhizophagus clarus]
MVFRRVQNLEADWYFEGPEVLYRRTTVWKKWTELFRRSETRSELKMDPISRQTRFASFWRYSRGIQRYLPSKI